MISMKECISHTLVFILIIISMIYAQDPARVQIPPHTYQAFMTKTGSESWGYGGVDVVGSDSIIFPYSNPALLSAKHFSVAIEFAKHWNARGPFGFKYDNRVIAPNYGVIQIPIKAWKLAAGYANYYDMQIIFDPEPIRTIQQPAGTGEFWDAKTDIQLHTFFLAAQYNLHPKFSIGLTMGANYYKRKDEIFRYEANVDDWSWQSVLGIAYQPDDNLAFAASFRYLADLKYTFEITGLEIVGHPDPGRGGSNNTINEIIQRQISEEVRYPWELKIGLSYSFLTRFQLLTMINFQGWSRVHVTYDDQQQFHVGLQAGVFSGTRLSLGYFTQWEAEGRNYSLGRFMNQNFLTLGLAQKLIRKVQFNISFMDSRLFSNPEVDYFITDSQEKFYQSKILLGFQYKFL